MALCAHRSETPAFWTPCRSCPCGAEVKAEVEAELATTTEETA